MAVADAVLPSTLTYKDRMRLQEDSSYAYNSLYVSGAMGPVWERLMADASIRQSKRWSSIPYQEGSTALYSTNTLSGFNTNSTRPSAVYTQTSFKPGHTDQLESVPLETLHPLTAKRHKQKYPVDFMAAIRPDAQTTNQTLRMLGTYKTDYPHAERFNMHIPEGAPGGDAWFHPDVVLTRPATAPTVHSSWNIPPYGPPASLSTFSFRKKAWASGSAPSTAQLTKAPEIPQHPSARRWVAAGHPTAAEPPAARMAAGLTPTRPSSAQMHRPASVQPRRPSSAQPTKSAEPISTAPPPPPAPQQQQQLESAAGPGRQTPPQPAAPAAAPAAQRPRPASAQPSRPAPQASPVKPALLTSSDGSSRSSGRTKHARVHWAPQ
mmetsp:Transcript_40256/g.89397  ORF Transcript_40256/g.89397 Transcript_40256/m.89397 type:complete len:378 (+) Transcript_40256:766-1899(+)